MKGNIKKIYIHYIKRVAAWIMLFIMILNCISPIQSWKVKAASQNMYGVWCPICAKNVDMFVCTLESNDKKKINCKACNSLLIEVENHDGDAHYSDPDTGSESDSWWENRVVKITTAVTFPWTEAYYSEDSDSDPEYRVRTQGDIYGNMASNNYGWTTEQIYDRASNLVENLYQNIPVGDFTWTQWHDTGKVEYETGTVYTGLSTYLKAYGITAQRVDSYTIIYDANGGSGSMLAQVSSGGEIKLTDNTFVKSGYAFSGWSTTANGNVEYTNGQTIVPTANMTLYAVWTANAYDVTCIDMDSSHNIELGRTTIQKTYGSNVKGSDFGADQSTGAYYAGYKYTVGTSTTVSDNDNIVYRYFAPQSYSVTLVDMILNEDTVLGTDTTLTKLTGDTVRGADYGTTSPYEGYTFNSDTSAEVSASGATVYRYFKRNNYTVSYVDMVIGDNGIELGRQNIDKAYNVHVSGADMGTDSAASAYYPGYYYTGNSSTAVVTIDGATVYRYFAPASYDITYVSVLNDIGGKELGREMKAAAGIFGTIVSGDVIGTDSTDGAYFPGYTYFASTQTTVTTDGAVVYRIFKSSSYDIQFELNDGAMDESITSYQYGVITTLPIAYRIGYSFVGWYDNAELTGNPITEINDTSMGAKTFYAAWSHDTYVVRLDYAGTGSMVSVYRNGTLVDDGTLYCGDTVVVDFGADAGRKQNGYDITSTVTEITDTDTGITFIMPDSDVNIITYWLECKELKVSLNKLFYDTYQVEPYWNGQNFNIDIQPAIAIGTDMVDVAALIYDTQSQKWLEQTIETEQLIFEGGNTVIEVNTTLFTICTDVFSDGYIQKGLLTLEASSDALDNVMNNTGSETYEELKEYVEKLESDILLYEQLVVDLQTKLQISNDKKKEYEEKIADLAAQLLEAQREYEKAVNESKQRIEELEVALKEKKDEYDTKVKDLTERIKEIEEILANSETLSKEEIEALTKQKEELSKELGDVIAAYEKETEKLKTELDSLYAQLDEYKNIISNLTNELETVKEVYEKEIADLEGELNTIRDKMNDLLSKIAEMENMIKDLLGRDDIDINNGSLEDLKNILEDLKNKINDLNKENSNLQDQVDNLTHVNDNLKDMVDKKEDEGNKLQHQIDDLTNTNNNLNNTIDKKKDDIEALNKIIEDLKKQLSSANESEERIDQEFDNAKKEVSQLQEQIKKNNQTIQEQQTIINNLEIQKEKLEKEVNILKNEVEDYKNQIIILQKQLSDKDTEIMQKNQEIAALKSYVVELENKGKTLIMSMEKEKEVSLADVDTQLVPLSLITVANNEREIELKGDMPVINEQVKANVTLTEGDNSQNVNPIIIAICIVVCIGGIGTGVFLLNRRYHIL